MASRHVFYLDAELQLFEAGLRIKKPIQLSSLQVTNARLQHVRTGRVASVTLICSLARLPQ